MSLKALHNEVFNNTESTPFWIAALEAENGANMLIEYAANAHSLNLSLEQAISIISHNV